MYKIHSTEYKVRTLHCNILVVIQYTNLIFEIQVGYLS